MKIANVTIHGAIDHETRCDHYHTEKDVIAIKFHCCNTYFPCYYCHEKHGCGERSVWPKQYFDQKAILCGSCKTELTINEYLTGNNKCPSCKALFNPGCSLHQHLYFEK